VGFVCEHAKSAPNKVFAGSVSYLFLGGIVVAGWQMGRALLAALKALDEGDDPDFMRTKILTTSFFGDHVLTRVSGLREAVLSGGEAVDRMPVDAF
jgi:hypothetical protein